MTTKAILTKPNDQIHWTHPMTKSTEPTQSKSTDEPNPIDPT